MSVISSQPPKVKLFVAALFSDESVFRDAESRMTEVFGRVDFSGDDHAFDATDYYASEMGGGLKRRLLSFTTVAEADALARAKRSCVAIENGFAVEGKRRVNLDVGYIDACKVILASLKGLGQKIYLADGVWADFVARYKRGSFETFEWTFPDFADGRYDAELAAIRKLFLAQVRATGV